MKATIRTELHCAAEKVWRNLLKRDTFLYITRGMLGFQGSERWPEGFREGMQLDTRLFLFHVIPGWRHTLRVIKVDDEQMELTSEEGGGIVRQWDHRISVQSRSAARCQYTDEIEIHAGWLTAVIWIFAHVFYRYRQLRWRRLARTL